MKIAFTTFLLVEMLIFHFIPFALFDKQEKAYVASHKIVYVAGHPDFYPLEYYDRQLREYAGIVPDLYRQVAADSGLVFQYINTDQANAAELAQNGQVEVMLALTSLPTNTVSDRVNFSVDYSGKPIDLTFLFTYAAAPELVSIFAKSLQNMTDGEKEAILQHYLSGKKSGLSMTFIVLAGLLLLIILGWGMHLAKKLREQKKLNLTNRNTDTFTGLYSLDGLDYHYQQLINDKNRSLYAVIIIDSSMKGIGRLYGIDEVYSLLKHIAGTIRQSLQTDELAARVSEYTFCVVKPSHSQAEMIAWLEELNRAIIDYSPASEKGYAIQMHYGIYFLRHGDQLADKALYNAIQAKEYARLKRMQYAVFDDEVLREANEYQAFEQEVLSGLENKEFVPFFQPFVDIRTGKVIGAEALARWESRTRGLLRSASFVPQLEKHNLISELDFQIFEKSCQWLSQRHQSGKTMTRLSCNFSRQTFQHKDFIGRLTAILDEYPFPHQCLAVEITESAMIVDTEYAEQNIEKLNKLNIGLFLDDFGVGYASFKDLCEYPFDCIKLDKSLIDNLDQENWRVLVNGLIYISHNMNFKIICEGIEREEQVAKLRALNCDIAQGNYFYRPLSQSLFETLLDDALLPTVY